ncbi:MAG: serine/threonine-protein kinase HipA [Colwellia sp.]|jgi:serine/threonine-protein kinase HipA
MANIDVYSHMKKIGALQKEQEKHLFSYALDSNTALSLTMPIRLESYAYNNLHPFFQMNLPEGRLREAIDKATVKAFGSDDLTMLVLLGNNQIGSVNYTLAGMLPKTDDTFELSLENLLKNDDVDLFTQLLNRFAMQSGVAGVQPKILLDIKEKDIDRITYPISSYIVKSWGDEFPELGCNEFFCLTIAKESGLDVSPFYLSESGKLLITKRFDIDDTGKSLGFEDFCVLQGKSTKQKYDASLESCANTISLFVSKEHKQQTLYDFFKLTVLNILLRNGDAHLKNYGVLYQELQGYNQGTMPKATIKFSPVFDIVSTTPYLPNDTMALSLTGSKRWPKQKVLLKFGKQHCGLSNKKIEQVYKEIEQAKVACLPLLSELSEKHATFSYIANKMREIITAPNG